MSNTTRLTVTSTHSSLPAVYNASKAPDYSCGYQEKTAITDVADQSACEIQKWISAALYLDQIIDLLSLVIRPISVHFFPKSILWVPDQLNQY